MQLHLQRMPRMLWHSGAKKERLAVIWARAHRSRTSVSSQSTTCTRMSRSARRTHTTYICRAHLRRNTRTNGISSIDTIARGLNFPSNQTDSIAAAAVVRCTENRLNTIESKLLPSKILFERPKSASDSIAGTIKTALLEEIGGLDVLWTHLDQNCCRMHGVYMRHASTHAATGVASDIYRCSGEVWRP